MEIILMLLFFLAAFLLMYWLQNRGSGLTGSATVVSRRVEVAKYAGAGWHGSGWNYLVTFCLSDGEEIELYTFKNEYKFLEEGLSGQLTWHKDTLSEFIPDEKEA